MTTNKRKYKKGDIVTIKGGNKVGFHGLQTVTEDELKSTMVKIGEFWIPVNMIETLVCPVEERGDMQKKGGEA